MLSKQENELLTRVGPQTPMGAMLRRYWVPACLSEELSESDGPPIRVRLLGEDLVAFRDTDGRVGIMDESCPHRGASLALGRSQGCGLTCLYHGWKIDVEGNILEMASEPEGSTFKDRLKHIAYPARESGGFVWAYMGPPEKEPPFPEFPWAKAPASHIAIAKILEEANWVQALEGAIDSAHSSTLHSTDIVSAEDAAGSESKTDGEQLAAKRPSNDRSPKLEVEDTPYGFCYAAIRKPIKNADTTKYVRITAFAAPFTAFIPPFDEFTGTQIFVPVDDHHTTFYYIQQAHKRPASQENWRKAVFARVGVDLDENYRKVRNRQNNYLQDRDAMKRGESFSGIEGVPTQDMAMQETMGPIMDRTKEHLGTSDVAIIRMRRIMLKSVREFQEEGQDPVGLEDPALDHSKIRAIEQMMPIDSPWEDLLPDTVQQATSGTLKG